MYIYIVTNKRDLKGFWRVYPPICYHRRTLFRAIEVVTNGPRETQHVNAGDTGMSQGPLAKYGGFWLFGPQDHSWIGGLNRKKTWKKTWKTLGLALHPNFCSCRGVLKTGKPPWDKPQVPSFQSCGESGMAKIPHSSRLPSCDSPATVEPLINQGWIKVC